MSRCTDCGGSTPAPYWQRCLECAERRLRKLMSPFEIVEPVGRKVARKWKRGDLVVVLPRPPEREGERRGKVARIAQAVKKKKGDPLHYDYVVDLEAGGRVYVDARELRER